MARKKKEVESEDKPCQYSYWGGALVRCGKTVKTLEPGFYDVKALGPIGYGLVSKEIVGDELIDIPGTIADEIFLELDKFLQTKDRYARYGLTHKRGYLFYGPPGSGKTSLGIMLARRFIERSGGVVMFCPDHGSFYNGVAILRDVEPGRPSMYLIEEADTIVNNTHCLSILDGELSIQGAVFVAMTNYKEKLPPRISNRPGRFDRVELVACPPEPVQLEYLRRVEARGGENPEAPVKIVKALSGLPLSLAHLREAFISHVLMGMDLREVRTRFEIMAGVKNPDGTDGINELFQGTAVEHCDDDDDSDEEYERQCRIDEAKSWEPDDDERMS